MEEKMEEKQNSTQKMKTNLGATSALVVSFDSTGSMYPCIAQVRENLRNLIESMTQDMPDMLIGLIAHGDYCDGENCILTLDLTNDLEKIMNFITNAPNTSGGDLPECYEFVLRTAQSFSWPETGGSLIMIGDAIPHEENPHGINWRTEVQALKERNIKVFPLQCLYRPGRSENAFWEEVSQIAETPLLMLESFTDSANSIEAVAYAAAGTFDTYKAKFDMEVLEGVRARATNNLSENQSKLDAYRKSEPKT